MSAHVKEIKHSELNHWHRYDIRLSSGYGWEYILATADYLYGTDMQNLQMVRSIRTLGEPAQELIENVRNTGSIETCTEAQKEGSSFSIGGVSRSLKCMTMITWMNQTSTMTIHTLQKEVNREIEEYTEKIIVRSFMKTEEEEKKKQKKNDIKLILSNFFLFIGFMLFAFCVFMLLKTYDFFGFCLSMITVSMPLGVGLLFRRGTVEKKKAEPAVFIDEKKEYLIITESNPLTPYMSEEGSAYVFTDKEKAEEFCKSFEPDQPKLVVENPQIQDYFTRLMNTYGFKAKTVDGKTENVEHYLNTDLSRTVYRCLQKHGRFNKLTKESLSEEEFNALKKELNALPLFVAFVYDDEDYNVPVKDGQLHMTDQASRDFRKLVDQETYYGINKLCEGKNLLKMEEADRVVYYGDSATAPVNGNAETELGGRMMHPRVAYNTKDHKQALTAFTNLVTLKSFYADTRVGLFTFKELAENAKDTDAFMLDIGPAGISAYFDLELVEELAKD